MKRNPANRSSKLDSYEHVLMCLICRSLFDDHDHQPKFLPCHHTFCKDCLREFVRQMGDEIECPSCRKPATIPAAGVAALQTNYYAKYIQSLVYGLSGTGGSGENGENDAPCASHDSKKVQYFCKDCSSSACDDCFGDGGSCINHQKQPLVAVAEDYQGKIDTSFARANALIERKKVDLEARLKAFSEEKDKALLKIDAAFETHTHLLNRRATLLKNKVIDSYNERVSSFESDFEEISTAMTCIVSLKEFHETAINRGQLADALKGVDELNEVYTNIDQRIHPRACHVLFEDKHGVEKFKSCVKDLGKVTCFAGPVEQKTPLSTNDDDMQDPPDVTPSTPDVPPSSTEHNNGRGDSGGDGGGGSNGRRFFQSSIETNSNVNQYNLNSTTLNNQSININNVNNNNNNNNNDIISNNVSINNAHNNKDIANNNNNNSVRPAIKNIDSLKSRFQRPSSARVKKSTERSNNNNDEDDDDAEDNNNNNMDAVGRRINSIKMLASPVRRPNNLINNNITNNSDDNNNNNNNNNNNSNNINNNYNRFTGVNINNNVNNNINNNINCNNNNNNLIKINNIKKNKNNNNIIVNKLF